MYLTSAYNIIQPYMHFPCLSSLSSLIMNYQTVVRFTNRVGWTFWLHEVENECLGWCAFSGAPWGLSPVFQQSSSWVFHWPWFFNVFQAWRPCLWLPRSHDTRYLCERSTPVPPTSKNWSPLHSDTKWVWHRNPEQMMTGIYTYLLWSTSM